MRLRLLPFVLLSCSFLLVEKTVGIVAQGFPSLGGFWVTESIAKTPEEEKTKGSEEKKDKKQAKKNAKDGDKETARAKKGEPEKQQEDIPNFTPQEIEVLERLSERRQQLDMREKDVVLRENVLKAAEIKLGKKLEELVALKAQVDELLKNYEDKENKKISRLVKIYENMKPKEAARIFERTELPVLLDILVRMPEKKSAPILAKMDPQRAKEVTTALALRKRLPES